MVVVGWGWGRGGCGQVLGSKHLNLSLDTLHHLFVMNLGWAMVFQ